ncbi:MAG TPA: hypothetical protein VFN56_02290 [Candidatus Saccharimonadales bacterium]|nr:hypothetical protein [Candidatus Saccharimonadales bacterium]
MSENRNTISDTPSPKENPVQLKERERWGNNIIRYDIQIAGQRAGHLALLYPRKPGKVIIDAVVLADDFRGQGYAKDTYKQIPSLPLPNGGDLASSGYSFGSSGMLSKSAQHVWESLAKDGAATIQDDGSYMLNLSQPPEMQPESEQK